MSRLKIIETKKQISTRKRLGVMVRVLRASFGLTQRQVADASGLSFSAVAKFERGELRLSEEKILAMLSVFTHKGVSYHHKENEITLTLGHVFLKTLYAHKSLLWFSG